MRDLNTIPNIEVKDPKIIEHKLMYKWGAWVSHKRFYAEDDEEAIFDSDNYYNGNKTLQNYPYEVALFQNNRKVKSYVAQD